MELAHGFRAKNKMRKHIHGGGDFNEGVGLDSETILVIKLPDSLVLRIIGRSFLLAMFIIALPCLGPILNGRFSDNVGDYEFSFGSDLIDFDVLNMVFRDLVDESLVKKGDKALLFISSIEGMNHRNTIFSSENEIDFVMMGHDSVCQSSVANESFDLVITTSFHNADFIDHVVRTKSIVIVVSLENCPLRNNVLQERSNYEIVYLRHSSYTIVAMIKTRSANDLLNFSIKQRLCPPTPSKIRKVASKGLKLAMIKLSRRALTKSNTHITQQFDTKKEALMDG